MDNNTKSDASTVAATEVSATESSATSSTTSSGNVKNSSNKTVIIIIAIIAILLLCCGCSTVSYFVFAVSDTEVTSDTDKEDDRRDNDNQDRDTIDDSSDQDEDQGSDNTDSTDQVGLPNGFELYPGTVEIFSFNTEDEDGPYFTFSGGVEGGIQSEIYAYYLGELSSGGWSITSEDDIWGKTVFAEKGLLEIVISVEGDDPTVTTITVVETL